MIDWRTCIQSFGSIPYGLECLQLGAIKKELNRLRSVKQTDVSFNLFSNDKTVRCNYGVSCEVRVVRCVTRFSASGFIYQEKSAQLVGFGLGFRV